MDEKINLFLHSFFIALAAKAQTEAETLEWLPTTQQTIRIVSSDVIGRRNGKLTFDESSIKVSDAEKSTNIQWNKIKYVTVSLNDITVVSNDLVDGKNVFIRLIIDSNISNKYIKALRHMATLKGAKMVSDDLF